MVTPDGAEAFRSGWFMFAAENFLSDTDPAAPGVTIALDAGDAPVHLAVGGGQVELRQGAAPSPDLTLTGEPRLIMGVLSGKLPLEAARSAGLSVTGDPAVLTRAGRPQPSEPASTS